MTSANQFRWHRVFLGLGSNLGNREHNILKALDWISRHPAIILKRATPTAETEPWGTRDQPLFLNAVAIVRTRLDPADLLRELKRAEKILGRTNNHRRWGPREIDLDILLFGSQIVETEELKIPHPFLTTRPFVLKQVLELQADITHPKTGTPLSVFLKKFKD